MSCPDELTLDLWSGDALPPEAAAAVAAHVGSCAMCAAQLKRWQVVGMDLQAALELDHDERVYLTSLDLGATWRTRSATVADVRWGWLALLGVVAAFMAWTSAGNPFGHLLETANQAGLGTVVLTTALDFLLSAGHSLIDVSTNPALGLTQPMLALLALALLFWPRITSAPQYLKGVHS